MTFETLLESNSYLKSLLTRGKFGLEKEHVRCDANGKLCLTPHPQSLGNKAEHPFITTDFSESQIEMITPPLSSLSDAYGFMKTLHQLVVQSLPEGEYLWLQSMPPVLPPEEDIPLAQFDGPARFKTEYRERLSQIYGKGRQMISGGHFNFSFDDELFELLAKEEGRPVTEVKEEVYLKVVRNLMRYRWWLVAMLGRSPMSDCSLKLKPLDRDDMHGVCCKCGVSIRSSRIGYRNPHPLKTDYSSVRGYLDAVDEHVKSGKLLNRNELYMPIRLKFHDESEAISHLEIRLLDLDPFDQIGMSESSLRLLHLFIIFSLLEPEEQSFNCDEQQFADSMQNHVACMGFRKGSEETSCPVLKSVDFVEQARRIIEKLRATMHVVESSLDQQESYQKMLEYCESLVQARERHPSARIIEASSAGGFIQFHLEKSKQSQQVLSQSNFRFHGFEDMELSTQLLLREAVKLGVHFEILDRSENFVRLHRLGKEELVMQATRTSLDKYSSVLAMENKLVTKRILANAGIRVPDGYHFSDQESAYDCWAAVRGNPIVVKPKTTNFGLGITILKENDSESDFCRAVELAFEQDSHILIEEFVSGKEYRFFLIDSQVVGILHRVPANVTGDGVRSIRELVNEKNLDPLRGKGYRTPLEKINLGEQEAMFLKGQGLNFDSVPNSGKRVFIRENSNISTGGDSLDYTECIHRSYLEVASLAANALGVTITGLDMMIDDINQPAGSGNHAIIEMNFNPAIHIHCFPYQGKNRHLDRAILSRLGFL